VRAASTAVDVFQSAFIELMSVLHEPVTVEKSDTPHPMIFESLMILGT
jgi:hypothetical protein